MNRIVIIMFVVVVSLGVSGCCMFRPKPLEPMAIEDALASLGRGFVEMKQAQLDANDGKTFNTGLAPAEAEVSFNVSRATTKGGKLYVEVSPIPFSTPVEGKAGAEGNISSTRTAGNTINVKFKSLLFATTSKTTKKNGDVTVSVQGVTDPEQLLKIYKTLEAVGIEIKEVPIRPSNATVNERE